VPSTAVKSAVGTIELIPACPMLVATTEVPAGHWARAFTTWPRTP
jgi:hypothetical protein